MGTFGRTDETGADTDSSLHNYIAGGKYNCPEEGEAQRITVYITRWDAGTTIKCAIYDASRNFIASTEEITDGGTGWVTFDFTSPPALVNADYILVAWGDSTANAKAESGLPANTFWSRYQVYNGWPDPLAAPTSSYEKCIYCTYGPLAVTRSFGAIIG